MLCAMPSLTVEQVLRRVEDKAAMLCVLLDFASTNPAAADAKVLSGLGDVFESIEEDIRHARRALDAAALSVEARP
jgi:hypothetical protein